jgi:hypothetical protein
MKRISARESALAATFFFLATIVFTWPIAAHLTDGLGDVWDAKLNAWILHWDFHQTFHDPAHLFDANIFHPARFALAFSENLYGAALFGFPLYAAGVSTLAAYNFLFLLGMFLSGIAAWALAFDVTEDAAASLLAGVVYAFVPWRLAQIPHIQYQWGAFLALLVLFLLRYLEFGRRRDLALFSLFFAWNAATNVHYAVFSGIVVAVILAYEWVASDQAGFRRRVAASVGAAVAAAILVLPLYLPYAEASRLYGMRRGEDEIAAFSGRPVDFLTAGPQNKLYAPLTQKLGQAEGDFFPGLTVIALAFAAVLIGRGKPDSEKRSASSGRRHVCRGLDALIALGILLWTVPAVFSRERLGPLRLRDPGRILVFVTLVLAVRLVLAFPARSRFADLSDFLRRMTLEKRRGLLLVVAGTGVVVALGLHTPYYRFLVESFGSIFRSLRVPSRGIVLFDLGLGVLAAWGLSLLARGRRWPVAVALLLTAFEYRAFPVDISPVEQAAAPVYHWLGAVSLPGAVIEWPFATDSEVDYEFRSTVHWKPLINGYSGFGPPRYHELAAMFAEKPIRAEVWKRMTETGACLLIVHPRAIPDESRESYAGLLRSGIDEQRLEPLTTFANRDDSDLVFRFADSPPFDPRIPASEKQAAARRTLEAVSELEHFLHPPFGVLDVPRENDTVASGAWGFGWALDDSGIAEIRVSFDGGPGVPTTIHQPHPGVREAHPSYPENAAPGFGFAVPPLPPGPHTLKVIFVGRDGGKTELQRRIIVR